MIWEIDFLMQAFSACIEAMKKGDPERAENVQYFLDTWNWKDAPQSGRIESYCEVAQKWAKDRMPQPNGPKLYMQGLHLGINKSNLLWRVLYQGEAIRATPCPTHQGRWSGLDAGKAPQGIPQDEWGPHCECGMTGWLKNANKE